MNQYSYNRVIIQQTDAFGKLQQTDSWTELPEWLLRLIVISIDDCAKYYRSDRKEEGKVFV